MKRSLLSLSCVLLFYFTPLAQDNTEAIKQTVIYWNKLHNHRNVEGFKNLYASDVLFYGKYRSRANCLKEKSVLYKLEAFQQDITSPIEVTFYSSGTIKCTFKKRTTYKQRIKEGAAYLLLFKEKEGYKVTGESDLQTDKRTGIQLDLGDEINKKENPVLLIVFISALLLAGGWYVIKHKKGKQKEVEEFNLTAAMQASNTTIISSPLSSVPQPLIGEVVEKVTGEKVLPTTKMERLQQTEVAETSDEQAKGKAFEEYIVQRFPNQSFELLEWRGDKYINGHYAKSSLLPDLEILLKTKTVQVPFAVECKWRTDFYEGKIHWAKDYQLRNYKQYEYEREIAVFVIIGIGGMPSNPQAVYTIPLREITSTVLTQRQLQPFYRYSAGNFFLNYQFMRLE